MPAKRKAAAAAAEVQTTQPEEAPPPTAEAATAEPPAEEHKRPPYPDVREQKGVRISPEGDKLRLLRSDRFKQLQIKADGELPPAVQERLKAEGWKDRTEDEGIWTKQLPQPGPDGQEPTPSRRKMVFDAERLFEEIANQIREDRGMPPVRLGMAAER
jgi:hypothetical protein